MIQSYGPTLEVERCRCGYAHVAARRELGRPWRELGWMPGREAQALVAMSRVLRGVVAR